MVFTLVSDPQSISAPNPVPYFLHFAFSGVDFLYISSPLLF